MSAGRPLTRQQLRDIVDNTHKLHVEFASINLHYIILLLFLTFSSCVLDPHSRVILKSKSCNDLLSSYINANYIRGYLGDSRAFIATQGPMVNTVIDFWQMAWQEESPVIVMITKLKEKNEKCVLYWPEKRGIYGKVEVLVNSSRECEHYTTRSLTLKVRSPFSGGVMMNTASGLGLTSLVCLSSVGIKPACCSITGTRRGLTIKPQTQRCRCCSSWPTLRRTDVPPPPWDRLLSTAGFVLGSCHLCSVGYYYQSF
ncbi:hypothetical protein XENOCAPTIV_027162 [Xenoophorus captivus]|uniref:protein-tyrosine-phosphatase n=1 Tax=Xenoophorus captivus TaxID=1517983 RepID=A0ABV0QES2_9TELE